MAEMRPMAVTATAVRVRSYAPTDRARWDDFVDRCPQATFFHRAGWVRVITEGLGHQCHYLLAERDGEVLGVLPLAEVRSRLFGHSLMSTPCCVYGGVAAIGDEARYALTEAAVRLAETLRVDVLELRNRDMMHADWPTKALYATFRRPIYEYAEDNLKAIPRKQRAMVRKGLAAGLRSQPCDDVERFFRLYSESVRNLGTPVFPRRLFATLVEEFRGETEMSVVMAAGGDIAGVMSFYFRDEVLPYYGGSRPAARVLKGNDVMYWELMARAAGRGARIFDFGRSKIASGAYDFKRHWGFAPEPLHYQYQFVTARGMPRHSPNDPRYRWLIAAWKHLPLPLANAVGPFFARNLG